MEIFSLTHLMEMGAEGDLSPASKERQPCASRTVSMPNATWFRGRRSSINEWKVMAGQDCG
jgi:hypothetical protein